MASAALGPVLQHIRKIVAAQSGETLTDIQLLHEFCAHNDQTAFASLVKRHGPMVLGVCRHVLHHQQDAEDAFQATFLVLARNAAAIRKKQALASWLHGVAYRMAINVKRSAARRRRHEEQAQTMPTRDPAWELAWREVQAILGEEIQRLPEKYRAVFVLCCLEGRGRAETGRQLGLKEGTVSSRLDQARKRLQQRLTRRGVTLSAVMGAAAIVEGKAAVPAALADSTVRAALLFVADKMPAAGVVSAEVAALVKGASKAMFVTKLKAVTVMLLAVGFVAAGAGVLAQREGATQQTTQSQNDSPKSKYKKSDLPKLVAEKQVRTDRYGDPLPPGAVARLGTLRLYHGQSVDRVTFSSDGKLVVSTAKDGNCLWDVDTGREVPLRDGLKHAFIFSWKGKLLAAEDGGRIWDLATGKEGPRPDVTLNAAGIPVAKGQPLGNAVEERKVLSPDGSIRAVAEGKRIRLWDTRTGKELPALDKQQPSFEGQTDQLVNSLTFSPDGKLLASTHGPTVRLWDLATGKEIRQFRGKDFEVSRTVFSADGKTLAGADGSSLTLWDVATGKWRHDFAHTYLVGALAFTPDGKTLLTGSAYSDPVIRVWDALTGNERGQWRGHTVDVQTLAVSPDGKLAVSGGQDRTLRMWDVATGKQVRRLEEAKEAIWSATFSPDGKTLASGGKMVRLWQVSTSRELRSFAGGPIERLAFSTDGKTLATASPQYEAVLLWDVATGRELRQFSGHSSVNPCFAFSPNGRVLATGDALGPIHLWNLATAKEIRTLGGPMKPDPRASYALDVLAFSPDGRSLAAGYSDETVRLWEIASEQERARFHGHRNGVVSLAFSPDGSLLASGSWDRTVVVWDVRGQMTVTLRHRAAPDAKELNSSWDHLASADAGKAYQAIKALLAASQQAVPFLREHLRAAATGDQERIAQLLAELDSDRFSVREKATRALLELGDQAEPALQAALTGKPSPELRRRTEKLLEQLDPAKSPQLLRSLRAVEALEHIGTAEAQQVLATVAIGAPKARLTQEAKASLDRLAKRTTIRP